MTIIWEEPPDDTPARRTDRQAILAAIKSRPLAWARLGEWSKKATAQQAASDVRCGRAIDTDGGHYESRWSEAEPGLWVVWVRWVPALSDGE